jgi:diphthamide synthase (EF-2-diphthine--ammonia ligase)
MPEPILFCWSGGKDSAMALHTLLRLPDVRIVALLTTVTETYDRISMHGVAANSSCSKPNPLVFRCTRSASRPNV